MMLLQLGKLEDARVAGEEGLRLTRSLRHARHEATLERYVREATYRLGVDAPPDLELVAATEAVGIPNSTALCLLGEAAFAWRQNDHVTCHHLGARAEVIWRRTRNPGAHLLARALVLATGPEGRATSRAALRQELAAYAGAPTRIQAAGLLGWHDLIAEDVAAISESEREICGQFLSPREAMQSRDA